MIENISQKPLKNKLKVMDLFSGIGGFSLGLERTGGFETVAFCEIDPFCQKVLKKHWPDVPIYNDVKKLEDEYASPPPDVICGGFPCQDISEAGRRKGINAERSGLWSYFERAISVLRPRYVIVENVSELLSGDGGKWFGRILSDLASLGYDAGWNCIQAADLGAAHIRDRVWVTAFLPDTQGERSLECWRQQFTKIRAPAGDVHSFSHQPEPIRVFNGVPRRMDRLRSLGNAVVPQIPEIIGHAILAAEGSHG